MRGWKKAFHANGNQKKAGVAIFTSCKIKQTLQQETEGHYIMIKGSTQEDYTTVVNIFELCTQHIST